MRFDEPHVFDITTKNFSMSIGHVLELIDTGALDLDPPHQRYIVWDDTRRSQFIESLLVGLPVPAIFLAEEPHGRISVIDGKQRLSAIHSFTKDEFRLRGLEIAHELNDVLFTGLSEIMRTRMIRKSNLHLIILDERSNPEAKNLLFVRTNTGGEPLARQEVRNAKFSGPLNDTLKELAEDQFLLSQLSHSIGGLRGRTRMSNVEYVLRFFALRKLKEWRPKSLGQAMDRFMVENQNASPIDVGALAGRYLRALRASEAIWAEYAFKSYRSRRGWRFTATPTVYDAQMLACDAISDDQIARVIRERESAIRAMKEITERATWENPTRISSPYMTQKHFDLVREMLEEIASRQPE
ncbi:MULTISPECIES: DUF262 domain-containing protein [Micromonospora]|uniref:DUF262 domain-containing protein n=1 Tax=Micromonospora TaxID=1873 RepID=UPI0033CD3AC1